LRDDCALAAILVLKFAKPRACRPAGPAIDADGVRARGAHALTIEGGKVRVETVADARGDRPWTRTAVGIGAQRWPQRPLPLAGRDRVGGLRNIEVWGPPRP
jgi:hypothetical protein